MRRVVTWSAAIVFAAVGCDGCNHDEAVCDARYASPIDAALDASLDAALDATPADAMPPDATPLCTGAGDTADHLEPLGGAGGTPQMVADGFGAVASYATATGGRVSRLGADGARRSADLVLAAEPAAIVFDGLGYVIVEQVAGPTVQVRTLAADGTLGAPTVIGAGQPIHGGLAIHASGDVAVLWRAVSDGTLRATVLPATGAAVETLLDTPVTFVNTQLVGGVFATASTTARFVAAFAAVDSISGTTVKVRPLGPTGAAVSISAATVAARHRVGIAAAADGDGDTALVTWRDDAGVHVATYHPTTGVGLTDRTVIAATSDGFTRVAGRAAPGGGFEILLDRAAGPDRSLDLYAFEADGDAVGASRRIATICTNAYSEENLAFVRNTSVRYVTWHDMTLPDTVAAAF